MEFPLACCHYLNVIKNSSPVDRGHYMKKRIRLVYLLLVLLAFCFSAKGQNTFASEEELKTQAAKLFDEDEFEQAYPLYSQLLSLYSKDPHYNFRLGVCMLYASDDKEKAIPYLEYAMKNPETEKEVHFYLARALHLNYRFDEAITQYMAYKKVGSASKSEKLMVDRQIEMCRNGKKLLRNLTDLIVIERKEMSRTDFYRSYDISDIGGKLLVKPDEPAFKSSVDKKKKENSIIYLATNNNQVYFSSYGQNTEQGKDIYIIRKLPNGEWSQPQTLGYPVNTEYDEDFPFLHPNGKVLYFCSKGHNSMGGYDIFKTTLNEETGTWNKPMNMDFPINTPDDDNLYVTNGDEKEAYFSSARSSPTGKTAVYHINVERKPIDVAIVKGYVMPTRENQSREVKITVKDLGDNTILGIYNSKAETGAYIINLPNGGKFMYTVESPGFATQSEIVVMPTQYEFKPLKQEILYETGTDKLIIKNLFDEPVDDASYLLALNFIKERAKMDVGTNPDTSPAASGNTNTTETVAANSGNASKTENSGKTGNTASLSNEDIVRIAQDDAREADKEANDLQEQADIALNLANQKNELAQNKSKEATQLMADAKTMDDNVKKQATIDEANAAFKEADVLNQETVAAFNIAKKLQFKAVAKEEEAGLSAQYAKDLEAAIKSKNPEEAMANLDAQEKKLEELSKRNGNAEPDDITSGLRLDEATKKREMDKAVKLSVDLKQEMADNEVLIAQLKEDAANTKKEDLKKGLLDQIAGLREENVEKTKELEANDQKIVQLQKEYNGIKNEMALVGNVVDKSKTGTAEEASAGVAAIDKTKLEKQVNEIKTSESIVAANTSVNPTAGNTASSTENKTTENSSSAENAIANNTGSNTENTSSENSGATEVKENYNQKYRDELAAAENISNVIDRENKKVEIYKEWKAAIGTDIAAKKQALKEEKDKTKKKEMSAEIAALEKGEKDVQKSVNTAVASAEKAKKDQSLASSQGKTTENSNASGNSTSAVENSTTENPGTAAAVTENNTSSGSSETVVPVNVNAKYTDLVAEADKITDPAERSKTKAEALNQWSAALDADIAKKKKDMAASDDPEMKALLAKKISDAELLSKEKKAEADRLSGTGTVIASNTSAAAENKTAETAGNAAENKTTETAGNVTENKTTETAGNTAENKTAEVAANVTENKTTETAGNATENKTAETVASSATENKTSGNATTGATENTGSSEATTEETNAASAQKTALTYSNASAAELSTKAAEVIKEAEALTAKAEDLKTQAINTKKKSEQDALLAKAEEAATAAELKKVEGVQLQSEANTKEIESNTSLLDQYALASAQNKSDDISIAEMMKDESKTYAERAEKSKALAASLASVYDKEAALEDALNNERTALEKQQKALELYKKNNPGFVPSAIIASNTVVTGNKTTGTAGSVTENKTTETAAGVTENKTAETSGTVTENKTTETAGTAAGNKTTETVATAVENKTTETAGTVTENKTTETAGSVTENKTTEISGNVTENKTTETAGSVTENKTTEIAGNVTENKTAETGTNVTENKTTETVGNATENKTTETAAVTENKTTESPASAALEPTEKFERTTQPVYSASKPIPVNEKLPEGLVYKVQIGAFRNKIAPEVFKGMSPITAETTPQGLTRYTAGLFTKISTAEKVKDEIRALGYKDAFVVAFLNGKRISLAQAIGAGSTSPPIAAGNNTAAAENTNTTAVENTTAVTANNTVPVSNEQGGTAQAKNVASVGGLFYTVQVGVYSQPVTAAKLKNCQPLYSESLPNGTIRYTTGIFNDLGKASEAKNRAVNAGIPDAFVSAYLNGKRISMTEAENQVKQGTGFSTGENMNVLPSFSASASQPAQPKPQPLNEPSPVISTPAVTPSGPGTSASNPANDKPVTVSTPVVSEELKAEVEKSNTMQVEPGLVYKVQIGAFKDEVPLEIANKFLKIANKGIRNFKDENGLTIYHVGSYKTYEEASQARTEVVNQSGVSDAFITAYNDGKKITIDEAKVIQGQ